MSLNLYEVFHATAQRQPAHAAILGTQVRLSYRELDETIQAVSADLRRAGIGPGTCVGLHVPSGANYIIHTYAAWRCGACVVPIPMELTPPEKQELLDEIFLDHVVLDAPRPFVESYRRGPDMSLANGMAVVPIRSPRRPPDEFATINSAFIRFTSGTTGNSKGVVLSHETIYERIHAANEVLHVGPADRVIWLLSMSYHFAVTIVSYLSFGATIVLPSNHFAAAVLEAAQRAEGTLIYGSPMHYAWMAQYAAAPALPGLRHALSTTASLNPDTARQFQQRFGRPLAQALGIIEVGLPCINVDFAADRPTAVGRVSPAYRLRLDDVGMGPGLGEVLFRGKGFLDAYYHPWRRREQILRDGWFATGDVGQLDADGCLFLRGRIKEVINVMGMKFFPQEVEAVLAAHPHVDSACVYPQRDSRLGEVPWARVVAKPGAESLVSEQELREVCRQRLADYKVPQRIEFVRSLPRTASGKVLHREVAPSP